MNFPSPSSPPAPPLPDPDGDGQAPLTSTNSLSSQNDNLISRTVGEAFLMFGCNVVLGLVLQRLGWTFFLPSDANSNAIAQVARNPAALFFMAVVMAPLIEEVFCRGFPLLLLRGVEKLSAWSAEAREIWYWLLGTASSFVFAVLHGMGDRAMQLPLPQLLMGFFLWRAAVQRGLHFSILMHACYNAIAVGLVLLAGNATPR